MTDGGQPWSPSPRPFGDGGGTEARDLGLDGFEIGAVIGAGGAATVYEAMDAGMQRKVAIKLLHRRLDDQRDRRAFEREVVALGRVGSHPHVITTHAHGLTRTGQPYLVLEHAPNGSLADRVRTSGRLPVEELLDVAIKVGSAVAAAHDNGVLHGDLKPSNVLLNAYDEPLLSDFGVADVVDIDLTAPTTQGHTIAYAPPEILDGHELTAAADVYSFAATCHMLATGQPVHAGATAAATIRNVLSATEASPLGNDHPAGLDVALRAAMHPDPAQRTPGMATLLEQLAAVQHELGLPSTRIATTVPAGATAHVAAFDLPTLDPAGSPTSRNAPREVDTPRRSRWQVALALPAIAAIAVAAFLLMRNDAGSGIADVSSGTGLSDAIAITAGTDRDVDCPSDGQRPPATAPTSSIDAPTDTNGRIAIGGTARADDGIHHLEAVLVTDDTLYWNPDTTRWQERFEVFQIAAQPTTNTDSEWTYTQTLPAGSYRLRTWAMSNSGSGEDAQVDHEFEVTDPDAPEPAAIAIAEALADPELLDDEAETVRVNTPMHGSLANPQFRLVVVQRLPDDTDRITVALASTDRSRWWNIDTASWQAEPAVATTTSDRCTSLVVDAAPGDYVITAVTWRGDEIVDTRTNRFSVY